MTIRRTRKSLSLILLVSLGSLIGSIILLSSVPPVSRDALTHHLFIPRLYVEHGSIYEIPNISFSYYPMNLDLLYMIPLYLGNDIVPKYLHFLFALLTAWLIYRYLNKRISSTYGLLGSLFFLSIPIIIKLSITVYVDLGLMYFSTASLLLLFRWLDSGYKTRYLLLAGICSGLAAGTKYNGLLTIFLLPLFIPVLYIRSQNTGRQGSGKGIIYSILFMMAVLAAFSPWFIRNYIWTGNPIYPLHDTVIQKLIGKSEKLQQTENQKQPAINKKRTKHNGNLFISRKILYQESWWQTLFLPIRFFFEGRDDNPRYFDGKLTPFLILLPFFAFLRPQDTSSGNRTFDCSTNRLMTIGGECESCSNRIRREKYALLTFAVLFFLFTFFLEAARIRYIVTIIPALVLLSIYGLHNLGKLFRNKRIASALTGLIAAGMLAYNCHYLVGQFQVIQPLAYLRGEIDRESFITRFRPEYPAIQYANKHLPPSTKVLCLFLGKRGYYMNFQPIFVRPGKNGLFHPGQQDGKQPQINIIDVMARQRITHILLRNDLTNAWYRNLDKKTKVVIARFFQKHTIQLFSSGGYSLYAVQ